MAMQTGSRDNRPRIGVHLYALSRVHSLAVLERMFRLSGDFSSFNRGSNGFGLGPAANSGLSLGRRLNCFSSLEAQCGVILRRLKRGSGTRRTFHRPGVNWILDIAVFSQRSEIELLASKQFLSLVGLVGCEVRISFYVSAGPGSVMPERVRESAERVIRRKFRSSG